VSLRESHRRFTIGQPERAAWMQHMRLALDDVPLDAAARDALRELFERSSAYVVNVEPAPPVADAGGPESDGIRREIERRWSAQRALDEAIAAVRSRAADRAVALADGLTLRTYFDSNRAVFAALLGQMVASADGALLNYVHEQLRADAALARERYSGRTLVHAAAAAGNVTIIAELLRLGADPNVSDDGGHTPLYSVANECTTRGGADVVRALVRAGARVDAQDGVKHCTALHMAARRGNVEVTEVLLDCGAGIEMRDSLGETPLRRAVNCGKVDVAALLLERGADIHSPGSKRSTPFLAARTPAMRRLIQARGQA
jgi:hypothetical protein